MELFIMSITNQSQNKWLVRVRARINGKTTSRKQMVTGPRSKARETEHEFEKELVRIRENLPRSLTLRKFSDVLSFWTERTKAKLDSVQWLIDRMKRDLGEVRIEEIKDRFGDFLHDLETEKVEGTNRTLSPATRNRYLVYARTAFSLAVKQGKLKENPLEGFDRETETARDRVWTEQERKAIFKALEDRKSHLFWPVYFMSMNPIRKGDLIGLKREHLNLFKPEVHFVPQKTGKRKPREAHLICIDTPLLEYFKGIPAGRQHLFTRKDGNPLGDFKKEWHAVLRNAETILEKEHAANPLPDGRKPKDVLTLRTHDLKHCAITFMLDKGFRELDLRNLGIQYSSDMIRRYYHEDADKALETWQRIRDISLPVAPECGPLVQKTA
jgi:integrase